MEYLTQDKSCIKEIVGLGTQKPIKINTHESKFVALQDLSKEEWIQTIRKFQELIYINHELKISAESDSKLFKIFLYDTKHNSAFSYIQTDYLKKQFEKQLKLSVNNYREIISYLEKLTLSEQIDLWRKIKPQSHEEYQQSMRARYISSVNPLDITLISKEFDFVNGVNYLISLLSKGPYKIVSKNETFNLNDCKFITNEGYKQRALQLLVYLQQSGLILFSIGTYIKLKAEISAQYSKITNTGLITPAIINSPNCKEAISILLESATSNEKSSDDRDSSILSAWFLMSTTINDVGDLSTELIETATAFKTRHYKWFQVFINVFSNDPRYKDIPFPSPRRISKNSKNSKAKSRSLDWARVDLPHLKDWIDLFEEYNKKRYVTYSTSLYVNSSYILDYLALLDSPPGPNVLNGNLHIRKVDSDIASFTIREFLDDWIITTGPSKGNNLDSSTKCNVMNYWRNVMDYFCGENIKKLSGNPAIHRNLLTSNPISELDCVWKVDKNYRTHRKSMKQNFVDMAKNILLSPDENGKPTFEWVRNHNVSKFDWVELPTTPLREWEWCEVQAGITKYWQPSRALLLYLMLELPVRSFQARWMDSGIADEFYWENGEYIKNTRTFARKGRKMGAFQPLSEDGLGNGNELGLYVSTNKTQIWNPEDFRGYIIPWANQHLYDNLQIQREWIDLVSEITHTDEVSLEDVNLDVQPMIIDLLPKFYPLFRDLSSAAGNNLPISKSKLSRLWVALCKELEDRCNKNNIDVKFTKKATNNSGKEYLAIYDLHSLRVSGITNLTLRGVPIHLISKYIAGHASIAMTLHYEKQDPIEVRKRLNTFLSNQSDFISGNEFKNVLDLIDGKSNLTPNEVKSLVGEQWFNRFLISQSATSETALNALMAANKQLSINIDGICPAARCSEGDEDGGPVRGGPYKCGNCRFFVTGTAFLYGQAHKCNLIMYEIKGYADELIKWRKTIRQFELGQTNYETSANRIAELEDKLEAIVSDWWGRYKLLNASLESLETQKNDNSPNTANQVSDKDSIKLITNKTNKVELLKELALSTELLEVDFGFKGPEVELREVLNVILSKHGISPFLVGLPNKYSLYVTNLMAESIVSIFELNNKNNKTLAYEKMQELIEQSDDANISIDSKVKNQLQALVTKFESIKTSIKNNSNELIKNGTTNKLL
jgi:hypothetical protein